MIGTIGQEYASATLTPEAESYQAQFTPYDYGRVGDQRPYQVVYPSYPAPEWLDQFASMKDALSKCDTLCQRYNAPFRAVKWGGRIPCFPCAQKIKDNRLPSIKIYSKGALEGYPEAIPLAEVRPNGERLIFAPDGSTRLANRRNFYVRTGGLSEVIEPFNSKDPPPLSQTYVEAVKSAEWLASHDWGKPAWVCSGFNEACKGKPGVPVVYVQPGGLTKRYPDELRAGPFGSSSVEGSTVITQPVTPEMFKQLIAISEGASDLAFGS